MKIIIGIVIAVVVALGIAGAVWVVRSAAVKIETGTPVRLQAPIRGELVETVSAPGEVEPMTKVSISARVSARIVELPYREGAAVTKGDPTANPPVKPSVLVRLDDTDLKANLKAAQSRRDAQAVQIEASRARLSTQQAAINTIRVSYEDAVRNLEREKALLKSHSTPQSSVDQAQCAVDKLAVELDGAKNSLAADEKNLVAMQHMLDSQQAEVARCSDSLTYTEITSPIDGIVTRRKAEVGELVVMGTMNNPGTEVMQVADLSKMLVVAQVDEVDIGSVKVGQRAKVRMQAYAGKVFDATVQSIALVQNPGTALRAKYYEAKLLLATGGQQVLSGLTADVEIETRRHENVLRLPSQAVLGHRVDDLPPAVRDCAEVDKAKAETTVVYRCIDGKAVLTPVKIGPADATHSVILSGLCETDKVIVGPYKVLQAVYQDQPVRDERPAAATAPATVPASGPATRPATAATTGAVSEAKHGHTDTHGRTQTNTDARTDTDVGGKLTSVLAHPCSSVLVRVSPCSHS